MRTMTAMHRMTRSPRGEGIEGRQMVEIVI
jgi:hypothetical protein